MDHGGNIHSFDVIHRGPGLIYYHLAVHDNGDMLKTLSLHQSMLLNEENKPDD